MSYRRDAKQRRAEYRPRDRHHGPAPGQPLLLPEPCAECGTPCQELRPIHGRDGNYCLPCANAQRRRKQAEYERRQMESNPPFEPGGSE